MNQAVWDYLAELQARNYSRSRINQIRHAMELLIVYLQEHHRITEWREVGENQIYEFAAWIGTKYRTSTDGYVAMNTLKQWLSCVRVFFSWMKARSRLLYNPA